MQLRSDGNGDEAIGNLLNIFRIDGFCLDYRLISIF